MSLPSTCRIQADAIVVSSQQVLTPGQVVISRGRVVQVTDHCHQRADIHFDGCALLPGLINPHTHLEFSDLCQPLPAGQHFPEWIQGVLARRQQTATSEGAKAKAITCGLVESRQAGVAALGDIVSFPWRPEYLAGSPQIVHHHVPSSSDINQGLNDYQRELLRLHLQIGPPLVVAFIEQLGLTASRRSDITQWREQLLELPQSTWPHHLATLALSPHAPYSTPLDFIAEVCALALRRQTVLAMHVLESPAERQWLDDGSGPMAEMLAQLGAGSHRMPADFVAQLITQISRAPSSLLIHGNYLTPSELDHVAAHKNLSIVYCPRTHAHFGHQPYPLSAIQKRGIRLLLGTDSRSTNPDLNLWQEAREALRWHPSLSPTQAFAALTDSAASALQLSSRLGSLESGRLAFLNAVRLKDRLAVGDHDRFFEQLFSGAEHPTVIEAG